MRGLNVAVVDWSAASAPSPRRPSADAIWLGLCTDDGEDQHYCRACAEAGARLADLIATGDWLEARVENGPDNRNNRFAPPRRVTLAEIYPSLLGPLVRAAPGIKDRAQVRLLARALRRLAREGRLGPLMADVPFDALPDEGWILGAGHAALLGEAATWP